MRRSARVVTAAAAGTFIEWYEYALYAFAAGLVIAPLFFAEAGSFAVLATFATFAVGFAARPLGGIVLGAAGDRWGRRPVLVFSILLMGVATTAIGLLPSYATIGVWAPILLVLLRLVQGFGAGAELGAAMIFVNESTPRRNKAFKGSFLNVGAILGSTSALLVLTILSSTLTPTQFLSWGWRLPFLFAAVLTVVCVLLRRKLDETPEFRRVEQERRDGRADRAHLNPFRQLAVAFRDDPRNFAAAFLMPCALSIGGYIAQVFGINYLKTAVGLSATQALTATLIMMLVGVPALIFWGWLSDRIGAKKVLYIGSILGIPIAFGYFLLAQTGNFGLVVLASCLLWCFTYSCCSSTQMVLMPPLFRPQYRGSGMISARELQGGVVAGPAPLIAGALALALDGAPWLVAGFIALGQVLTIAGMILARPVLSQREIDETSALRGLHPTVDASVLDLEGGVTEQVPDPSRP
ncbi:MFS transporter [Pseudonocardia yuanmonensis]|uniref:MFS transporter n=1 Tax=Pseudonocardia yuanmonensis TaxID=1095914 RepID=A0ABP8WKF9_9PSEU